MYSNANPGRRALCEKTILQTLYLWPLTVYTLAVHFSLVIQVSYVSHTEKNGAGLKNL